MPALDTNVLVRLIVVDDPQQADLARSVIASAIEARLPLFVAPTVVLELEWCCSRYGFERSQILEAVSGLLASDDLEIGEESAVEVAVAHYRDSRADFADCLHAGMAAAAGRAPLLTFDRGGGEGTGGRDGHPVVVGRSVQCRRNGRPQAPAKVPTPVTGPSLLPTGQEGTLARLWLKDR